MEYRYIDFDISDELKDALVRAFITKWKDLDLDIREARGGYFLRKCAKFGIKPKTIIEHFEPKKMSIHSLLFGIPTSDILEIINTGIIDYDDECITLFADVYYFDGLKRAIIYDYTVEKLLDISIDDKTIKEIEIDNLYDTANIKTECIIDTDFIKMAKRYDVDFIP
jgi:hypothetical protein